MEALQKKDSKRLLMKSFHKHKIEKKNQIKSNQRINNVPALGVKPVPELVETLLGQEEGRTVVKVGIELVDHGLIAENAEETSDESQDVHQK